MGSTIDENISGHQMSIAGLIQKVLTQLLQTSAYSIKVLML